MKGLSTYIKEMKIASRGFYFYIEIFVAVIMLIVLLVAVNEKSDSKVKEYIYYDMSDEALELMVNGFVNDGLGRKVDDTEFTLKTSSFEILNKETNQVESYDFDEEKTIKVATIEFINNETGLISKTLYIFKEKEDMIRLSNSTGTTGSVVTMNDQGDLTYAYYLQGYETQRLIDMMYLLHVEAPEDSKQLSELLTIREIGSSERLNNREAIIPVFVAFSGALMAFFIIMSYIFLDKSQGVIKAFAVTPASVYQYLLSKVFVVLTTVIISSTIVVLPIMKFKPDYILFYVFLLASTFGFSTLGLLVASFFDNINKAFGVLYVIMIAMMLPAFSYFISSFDPLWIRFFPTYPLLEGFKSIMKGQGESSFILIYSAAFLVGGGILLSLANRKFKKSLTV